MATNWSVQTESNESADWTVDNLDSLASAEEKESWGLEPVSPNASGRSRVMGWGNWAAEDFHFLPEELDIVPEEMQADRRQWTITEITGNE